MSGWADDVAAEASILFNEYRARAEAAGANCDGVTIDDFIADAIDRVGQDPDSVSIDNNTGNDSGNDSSQPDFSWDEGPDNPANYPSWLGGTRADLDDDGRSAQEWLEKYGDPDQDAHENNLRMGATNDDELHESFYRSEQYKESAAERLAREMHESSQFEMPEEMRQRAREQDGLPATPDDPAEIQARIDELQDNRDLDYDSSVYTPEKHAEDVAVAECCPPPSVPM